jgi:hypothetical protein
MIVLSLTHDTNHIAESQIHDGSLCVILVLKRSVDNIGYFQRLDCRWSYACDLSLI